ncbi:energy-coupling factor ABC transporter permease [Aeromicrobium flavum]|uniref:energy-coupling factor ABC transporter permease n=1 Tax=Aeromicrobium flavum TaxID=416568 RepID=UPI0031D0895A
MHVPDHFLDTPTSVLTAAVALAGVAVAGRLARQELPQDQRVPAAGLVATFVFAAQMLNFPVGGGTSGHLIGGALAAVLVGPATAVLCLSGVLLVQALCFADGGVTALGTNVTLLSLVAVLVGWGAFRAALLLLPRRPEAVPYATAVAAFVSVPAAAVGFAALYAVGGTASVDLGSVTAAMVGWHALIGLGEAVISFVAVAAVVRSRPDLVFGARSLVRSEAVAA